MVRVQYYFGAQAAIVEGRRSSSALARSGELVEDRWWETFGVLLAFGAPAAFVSIALAELAGFVAGAIGVGSLGGPLVTSAIILTNALASSFTALAGTLLFFDLRARTVTPEDNAEAAASQRAPGRPFAVLEGLRQAGFDGDLVTRISVLGRGSTRYGPSEEVLR